MPILIFANKQDLSNLIKVSEIAEAIGLVKLKDRTWQIQECSAIQGNGIKVIHFKRLYRNNLFKYLFYLCWTGGYGLGLQEHQE